MNTRRLLLISACLFAMVACSSRAADNSGADTFPYPTIPAEYKDATSRASYLITHYWDNYDFAEAGGNDFEQAFANFISVFEPADSTSRREAMKKLVELAHAKGAKSETVDEVAESYLYSPESPVYNEEYFIMYLQALLSSGTLTDAETLRPQFLLEEAMRNRVGFEATDFEILTREGRMSSLADLATARATLLIFVDPDCETCAETVNAIDASPILTDRIARGELAVVAVYTGDDTDTWETAKSKYPAQWSVGAATDPDLSATLYTLPSFPVLYLLDANRKVLHKNTSVEAIEAAAE